MGEPDQIKFTSFDKICPTELYGMTDELRNVCDIHTIDYALASKCHLFKGVHVVILCDDGDGCQYGWSDMRKDIGVVMDVQDAINEWGTDILFLNRPALYNENDSESRE